ncbi:MAG: hypothetical protein EG823_01910 [Actinobacteria bacterium]|nr:hypothetical protein [Actinomycetota bacterium]
MTRELDIVKMLAAAMVMVAVLGVATPVCAMPDCGDMAAGPCSDFTPACDDCPKTVAMKHTDDDAVSVAAQALPVPVMIGTALALESPDVVTTTLTAPEATASPPPLDPLGVRLTV